MDIEQIGEFLAQLRHANNLTQEQLGEKIGVTNKTISRWENGNYLPPVEALQQLSQLFGISINEILSGKKLNEAEYKTNAEENIIVALGASPFSLKEKIDFFKKKWKRDHATILGIQLFVIACGLIAGFIFSKWLFITAILAGALWKAAKHNQMMAYVERNAFNDISK